jgi:hypothetical protein
MKYLSVLLAVLLCGGCMTKNQLEAERLFYEAKIAMSKQVASQPIFEMVAADVKSPIILQNVAALRVFQIPGGGGSDNLTQYIQRDYAAPWLQFFGTLLAPIAPAYFAYQSTRSFTEALGKTGNITNTNNTINGNENTLKNAGNVTLEASNSGMGNLTVGGPIGGIIDSTSVPTVVTQPAPTIVTQPPPVIIEIPPPEIVIVEPSYPPVP